MVQKEDNRGKLDSSRIVDLLPGYNCGICGYARCDEFAGALIKKWTKLENCRFLLQEIFEENRVELEELLIEEKIIPEEEKFVGLLDGYEADIRLNPLPGEESCREVLFPFTRTELKEGDIIKYRPLGCPIIHFARILTSENGLITVHIIGPCHRLAPEVEFDYMDIGLCMVGGFEGIVQGKVPDVGETVRFLPGHCMMQKVHSGVVVQVEGRKVIIEGIDLKVWSPPIKG
ncbi:MAG TPA: (Fe-S)-binding protein [Methanobacterium sp.]|nr:(Fe-S)-binding protein [Methanobacterium sp.]